MAGVVKDDGVDLLRVALKTVHKVAGGNLPNADRAVEEPEISVSPCAAMARTELW